MIIEMNLRFYGTNKKIHPYLKQLQSIFETIDYECQEFDKPAFTYAINKIIFMR